MSAKRKALKIGGIVIATVVAVVAVIFGRLNVDEDFRKRTFAAFCTYYGANNIPEFLEKKCAHLATVNGTVVEIGPGAGANFICWKANNITDYVGIEPNVHFAHYLPANAKNQSVAFPVRLVHNTAEDMPDIATNSVDSVVSTHVLCSAGNIDKVLSEVHRILKPGGKFYFIEHVSAEESTFTRSFQIVAAPIWRTIGDGCEFRPIWEHFDAARKFFSDVQYEHFVAAVPFPVHPHIKGIATK